MSVVSNAPQLDYQESKPPLPSGSRFTPNQTLPSDPEIRRTYGIIDLGRNAIDQSLFIGLGQSWGLNALIKAGVDLLNGAEGLADLVGDNCRLIGGVIAG